MVYFIKSGEFVKIGFCIGSHALYRLSSLQTGNPIKLELLAGLVDGDEETESRLHVKYLSFHHRGEWFRYEGELKEMISIVAKENPSTVLRNIEERKPKGPRKLRLSGSVRRESRWH